MNVRRRKYYRSVETIAQAAATAPSGSDSACDPAASSTPPLDTILCGDCIRLLNNWPEGWADLVFADPPFNIGYLYRGYDDRLKTEDYLRFSRDWMSAVYRALKPTGSFYLAIGDEYAADLCVIARREIGFHMRNWIIWHYTFGQQTRKMFARSHTHILYFVKDPNAFTFNADAVRVASARQTTYGDSRANPRGKVPDDVWYLRPQEAAPYGYFEPSADTWFASRVCGTFHEREGWHGCQMPIAVLNRIILASSNPGDVVLDPMNGSGTTVVSAALLRRRYVGIDREPAYVEFARKRVKEAIERAAALGPDSQAPAPDPEAIHVLVRAAIDPNRESKLSTPTDAFGRKRVTRGKYRRRPSSAAGVAPSPDQP